MSKLRVVVAVGVLSLSCVGSASADSFFWAVNQFTTIQKINGDTGEVADAFVIPEGAGSAASIAVVGNTGYYTLLFNPNVYAVDMTTHAGLGVAFNTGDGTYMNGITTDASGILYFARGADAPLQAYSTTGTLLGTWSFPDPADSYRDGSVVFGNTVVANEGDQEGPYSMYTMSGSTLTYVHNPFIVDPVSDAGNNGIGFNGVNYYVANEQRHVVQKYDINGNYISTANLDPNSRYENWTFASQDIVVNPPATVPEPASLTLLGTGLVALARRRFAKKA